MIKIRECIFCGTILEEDRNKEYTCNDCERKVDILKQLKRVDSAKEKVEKEAKKKSKTNFSYQEERDLIIDKILKNEFSFNSTTEMCFAMQLERQKIKYYPNYKVGNHKVDFFLPDIRKIIEIDGELYHTDENKDFLREREIMSCVGETYEIVRIPASFVPKYTMEDIKDIVRFVVLRRNEERNFRDTRYDKYYIDEYISLNFYLGRRVKWQRKLI